MRHRARLLVLFTAVASAVALALTIATSRHASLVTAALVFATSWAVAISIADLAMLWRPGVAQSSSPSRTTEVAFVMSLGEERPDIARTSILLAAQAGSVHIVATRHHDVLDQLGEACVTEHVGPTIQQAVQDAADAITTDSVLLISASALPVGVSCGLAASELSGQVGWVIGSATGFNRDRYAPRQSDALSARVRNAARSLGLVTWEPDATIVRTSLLRKHPFDPTRPYGRWLRARSAEGYRGVMYSDPVAVQAAPSDAPVFWPMRTSRQRGVVADLADATTTGSPRTRLLAGAVLLRELFARPHARVARGDRVDRSFRRLPASHFADCVLRDTGRAECRSLGGKPSGVRHRRASDRRSARGGIRPTRFVARVAVGLDPTRSRRMGDLARSAVDLGGARRHPPDDRAVGRSSSRDEQRHRGLCRSRACRPRDVVGVRDACVRCAGMGPCELPSPARSAGDPRRPTGSHHRRVTVGTRAHRRARDIRTGRFGRGLDRVRRRKCAFARERDRQSNLGSPCVVGDRARPLGARSAPSGCDACSRRPESPVECRPSRTARVHGDI